MYERRSVDTPNQKSKELMRVRTTDPQHERFDLYDAEGNALGASKPRGEVHRDGDWHRSLHLWIWGIGADGEPFMLFQRRSMTKDTWPGALDVAVGGHFRSGETLAETLRESEEEIGLRLDEAEVVRIGRRFFAWRTTTFHDREINEAYAARCDQPLSAYRLHPEEIDGLARIGIDDVLRLFSGEIERVSGVEYVRARQECVTIEPGIDDFVDASDGYAVLVLEALGRLAAGEDPDPFMIQMETAG
jgi:isopentenyldiphosphate isomerase